MPAAVLVKVFLALEKSEGFSGVSNLIKEVQSLKKMQGGIYGAMDTQGRIPWSSQSPAPIPLPIKLFNIPTSSPSSRPSIFPPCNLPAIPPGCRIG